MTEFEVVSVQEKVPKAKIEALKKFDHLQKISDEGGNPYKYMTNIGQLHMGHSLNWGRNKDTGEFLHEDRKYVKYIRNQYPHLNHVAKEELYLYVNCDYTLK